MNLDNPAILYPFRKRDPLTGKWYRARWKVSAEELAVRAGEWIVDGPPEVYRPLGATSGFQAWGGQPDGARLVLHPQRDSPPAIDPMERFLAGVFLRRYVTWSVRSRRFAQAQGAAILCRELAPPPGP